MWLSSADTESARRPAAEIGRPTVVAVDDHDGFQGAAAVLTLHFGVLEVIDETADSVADQPAVVPSNPVGLDAHGNLTRLLPEGQASGEVLAGWLPAGTRLATAFGTMTADLLEALANRSPEPEKVGGIEQSSRLEVDGDLDDLVVGPAEARSLIDRA